MKNAKNILRGRTMIDNICIHHDGWHDIGIAYTDWCLLKGNPACDNCKDYERNIEEEQ